MLAVSNRVGFDISSQQILQNIGYAIDSEPPARIVSLVEEYLEHSQHLIDAVYSYTVRDVILADESLVVIEDMVTFRSKVIARLLGSCQKVVIFALTIGEHLEEMAGRLAEDGLILQAMVLDSIGSVTTEKLADFVGDSIGEIAQAQGLYSSRRFSPGYCDWPVDEQKMLFQSMDGHSAGITLTDGCLMLPRKSISGIIGLGDRTVADYNPCQSCPNHDCAGRR